MEGARNLSNVIYSRIRDTSRFDPIGWKWADWIPRTDNAEWNAYLAALAAAADHRAAELGARAAREQSHWAVEAFGSVPEGGTERTAWEQRTGLLAAYRELQGDNDPADALGAAPRPGQVEAYAAYRAAWRALGRPEIEREELECSDGQLRTRIRAWEREKTWGPRYVANGLAGTNQTAATHRHTAAMRAAEAGAAEYAAERARLHTEAAQTAALAELLDAQAAKLQAVDDARACWLAHTALTRVKAERAQAELNARHLDDTQPEQRVTAQEWLVAHRAALAEDERHRIITDTDLAERPDQLDNTDEPDTTDELNDTDDGFDTTDDRARADLDECTDRAGDRRGLDRHPGRPVANQRHDRTHRPVGHTRDRSEHDLVPERDLQPGRGLGDRHKPLREPEYPPLKGLESQVLELPVPEPDVRDVAAREPAPVHEDVVRVPTAQETSEALVAAHRTLAEIRAREVLDGREAAEHRSDQLIRWHADDRAAEEQEWVNDAVEVEPVGHDHRQP